MPNVSLTEQMQEYADREVAAGAYSNVSEVVRAGLRRLMEDDGAAAFYRLRRDLEARMAGPTMEVDLREIILGDLTEDEPPA